MVRSRAGRPSPTPRTFDARAARAWIVALLLVHAALALWAMARNSVTFDENFHLPAGLMILERGDFTGSIAQPPLPKVLYALPAAMLGARLPDEQAMASGDEGTVGESFMRRNWEHYGRLYFASRLVALLFSLALAWLVWRWTRTLFGEAAGVLATALYALSPQAISFAAVVGTDLPTALAFTWVLHRLWRFLNAPGRRTWAWLAVAWSAAFLTRFSAVQRWSPACAAACRRPGPSGSVSWRSSRWPGSRWTPATCSNCHTGRGASCRSARGRSRRSCTGCRPSAFPCRPRSSPGSTTCSC